MSGGGTTQQQTQNKDPWAPSVPYLNQIMSQGQNLYNSGAGSQTWGGPLVASQSPQTSMGINSLTSTAQGQQGTAGQPLAYGQNQIANNGLTPGYQAPMSTYGGVSSGQNGITTGSQFGSIAGNTSPTSSASNLAGIANGSEANNPYIQQMLNANDARITNRVNSSVAGAGRYGSGGHTDVLARSLAEADNPVLAQAYSDNQNRRLSAAGQIDQSNNAALSSRLAALQGQTGVQGQNIANQLQGAAGQTGILNQGQQNAAQWASMIPQLQQASYMPGQQLMAAGQYQQGYDQQNIDAQRALFQQQQQMPWTQLANYSGAVSGLSPLMANAGSMTGTVDQQKQLGFQDFANMFAGGAGSAAAGMANAGSAGLGTLGSSLGSLAMLSDRNEKTDITKLGDDPKTGLPMYSYRYKSDVEEHGRGIPKVVGPMAQDVEAAMPGSTERIGGKLYIKPEATARLGILGLLNKKAA